MQLACHLPDHGRIVGRALVADRHEPNRLMAEDRRHRVLVVEDNSVNQALTEAILAKLGYGAEVAGNGREAVEAVARAAYGAVLMDYQLPVMDGYQATAEIRRREGSGRHTPIIAMTAAALPGSRERCLAAGMDDYIAKPVLVSDVQAALSRWLHREATEPRASASADSAESARDVLDPDRLAELWQLDSARDGSGFVRMLVDCFLTRAPADFASLRAAVQRGDATAIYHVAHRLKGAAATLGSPGMVEVCQALETLATTGELTPARELLGCLEHEFGRVTSALDVAVPRR
jgi:CheY-like chemotaxis protein/HPt (histidine-containing phosphotransfer) domain-containing protein